MKKATLFSSLMPRANKEVYKFGQGVKQTLNIFLKETLSFLIEV